MTIDIQVASYWAEKSSRRQTAVAPRYYCVTPCCIAPGDDYENDEFCNSRKSFILPRQIFHKKLIHLVTLFIFGPNCYYRILTILINSNRSNTLASISVNLFTLSALRRIKRNGISKTLANMNDMIFIYDFPLILNNSTIWFEKIHSKTVFLLFNFKFSIRRYNWSDINDMQKYLLYLFVGTKIDKMCSILCFETWCIKNLIYTNYNNLNLYFKFTGGKYVTSWANCP